MTFVPYPCMILGSLLVIRVGNSNPVMASAQRHQPQSTAPEVQLLPALPLLLCGEENTG